MICVTAITLWHLDAVRRAPSTASSRAESEAEIEEERRLLYVAMTRAERDLTIIVPMQRPMFGPASSGSGDNIVARSRFIPDAILDPFKVSAWRSHADEPHDDEAAGHAVQPDLAARIRNRWADA